MQATASPRGLSIITVPRTPNEGSRDVAEPDGTINFQRPGYIPPRKDSSNDTPAASELNPVTSIPTGSVT
jgi:hypothetical protein